MKVRTLFGSVFAVFIIAASLHAQSRESLLQSVKESTEWRTSGNPKQYDERNLKPVAGKAASTLQRYGVTGVSVQDWTGDPGRVRMSLYEMVDASAAYGFFTFERLPEQTGFTTVPLGTEGFRVGDRTCFWQSKYVVKLEGDAKATDSLARLISRNIFGRSRKPMVSDHVPLNSLVPNTEKYIVDAAGVPPGLGLDPSALGFEDDVEIATARYEVNGKQASLVLLLYPTQHVARKYTDDWDAAFPDEQKFRKRVGPLVALVRDSRDANVAKQILDSIGYESQVTWNQARPDLSIREVILTIFTGIGIGLLFTLVAGLSFGGLRVFMKAKYPDRIFDRPQDMEIIQLKLDQGFTRKELGS